MHDEIFEEFGGMFGNETATRNHLPARGGRLFGSLLLFLLLLAGPLQAAPKLSIDSVQGDLVADTITITGVGFDRINDTDITLGGFGSLAILSETATEIVVTLPPAVTPGSYLLTVVVTQGSAQTDEFRRFRDLE